MCVCVGGGIVFGLRACVYEPECKSTSVCEALARYHGFRKAYVRHSHHLRKISRQNVIHLSTIFEKIDRLVRFFLSQFRVKRPVMSTARMFALVLASVLTLGFLRMNASEICRLLKSSPVSSCLSHRLNLEYRQTAWT